MATIKASLKKVGQALSSMVTNRERKTETKTLPTQRNRTYFT